MGSMHSSLCVGFRQGDHVKEKVSTNTRSEKQIRDSGEEESGGSSKLILYMQTHVEKKMGRIESFRLWFYPKRGKTTKKEV